ncbi:MAG TPA: RNB domain-containing ribonuclease, partial [Calditrichia bacterium]|nr:RNB domain-containing ribonuclease [Calditrichia bacterium]
VRFILDDKGQPVDIVPVQRMHSNEMIEEFMLLANQTVTKHVYKISPKGKILPFVYRVHEKPDKEKLQKFQDFLRALGHKITLRKNITPSQFQEVLLLLQDSKDAPLIREVALRTMMKAVYSPKNIGHFGLAFEHYTHFTSPIRRYPDLMVHRLLKEYDSPADNRRQQQLVKKLPKICQISSERERQAMEAERESVRIKQIEWISAHRDQLYEGLISGVTSFGIFVETLPFLIEGLIRMDALEDDYYIFDERTYSLTGKDTGRVLRLGDPVKVRISNIDLNRKEVDFVLVEHQSVR